MSAWISRPDEEPVTRFTWLDGKTPPEQNGNWQKIVTLPLAQGHGRSHVVLGRTGSFRLIKLRSRNDYVEVFRWTLRFEEGAILDPSVNCLRKDAESRPLVIAGRRLHGMVVEYEARKSTWRGRLEIWAQS